MKRYALIGLILLALIAFNSNANFYAQQPEYTLKQRVKLIETRLQQQNKAYKVIGENNVAPNGKIVQKISSSHSFEILALPMVETADARAYSKQFVGKLYTAQGLKLSEVTSDSGMRVTANVPETYGEKKLHSFEFINPNNVPVKVRFYYVQN